jgi:hypothetical protein
MFGAGTRWGRRRVPLRIADAAVLFKGNAKCRHRIPKQRCRLTNWPVYEAGPRKRGDLTVWFSEAAIAAWRIEPRTNRGGQPWYSPLPILTALTLRAVVPSGAAPDRRSNRLDHPPSRP